MDFITAELKKIVDAQNTQLQEQLKKYMDALSTKLQEELLKKIQDVLPQNNQGTTAKK